MYRNNLPFQMIVTRGSVVDFLNEAGKTLDELAAKTKETFAVFDRSTNLSVKLDTFDATHYCYIAYADGRGNLKFLGDPYLELTEIESITKLPYKKATKQKIKFTNFEFLCGKEYVLKLEFRSAQIMNLQGYNTFTKTYQALGECCNSCATCNIADPNKLAVGLFEALVIDKDALFDVKLAERGAATEADIAVGATVQERLEKARAFVKTNANATNPAAPTKFLDLILEMKEHPKIAASSPINAMYQKGRSIWCLPCMVVENHVCSWAKVDDGMSTVTGEQGGGYDVRQLEYLATGWQLNPSPYKMGAELPINGIELVADPEGFYTQIVLDCNIMSAVNWHDAKNGMRIIIALKQASAGTANAALDPLITLLKPLVKNSLV